MNKRYRMNRAVGVFNKGDTFESDDKQPMVMALLGAGYAELVYEGGEDDGGSVYREPGPDAPPAASTGDKL